MASADCCGWIWPGFEICVYEWCNKFHLRVLWKKFVQEAFRWFLLTHDWLQSKPLLWSSLYSGRAGFYGIGWRDIDNMIASFILDFHVCLSFAQSPALSICPLPKMVKHNISDSDSSAILDLNVLLKPNLPLLYQYTLYLLFMSVHIIPFLFIVFLACLS